MPPSALLLATFLLISQFTGRGRAKTVTYTLRDHSDLRKHCSFDFNGLGYDLCPLMGSARTVQDSATIERHGGSHYLVALGGFGKGDISNTADAATCDADTWICTTDNHQTVRNIRSRQSAVPFIRKDRGSKVSLILDFEENLALHGTSRLQLLLRTSEQALHIAFLCSDAEKLSLTNRDGPFSLVWSTPQGCSLHPARHGSGFTTLLDSWADGEQGPEGDNHEGEGELLPSDSRRAKTGIALVITFLALTFICGSILASSARARHFITRQLRSASYALLPIFSELALKLQLLGQSFTALTSKTVGRFRQEDSNLVRWVQEDMALDAEDMMDNGNAAYDFHEVEGWLGDGSSEYIPLTTSPRYGNGRRVQSYGSTPDVETFEERGAVSRFGFGFGRYFKKV